MGFPPTDEQNNITAAFLEGKDLIIQAGAGCGKTSTLALLAAALFDGRRGAEGIYITLNKSVAKEVKATFEKGNVQASTIHSFALKILKGADLQFHEMVRRRLGMKMKPFERPEALGVPGILIQPSGFFAVKEKYGKPVIKGQQVPLRQDDLFLKPYTVFSAAMRSISLFCTSDSLEFTDRFVKSVIRSHDEWCIPDDHMDAVVSHIYRAAEKIWNDAMDPHGVLPYSHDWYLKYACSLDVSVREVLGLKEGSVLFFDEAQDARPVLTEFIERQRGDLQIVAVGDSAQAIYGFTGAKDALKRFARWEDVTELPLSTSWRFGQGIADAANLFLITLKAPIEIKGNPAKKSRVVECSVEDMNPSSVDAVICRSNTQVISTLTESLASGLEVFCEVDTKHLMNLAIDIQALEEGRRATKSDLKIFPDISALEEYLNTADRNDDMVSEVNLMRKLGADVVIDSLDSTVTAKKADLTISTIHKSKGRQWDRVAVKVSPEQVIGKSKDDDDQPVPHRERMNETNRMLMYVAITRGQSETQVDPAIMEYIRNW